MGKRILLSFFIALTVMLSACGDDSKEKGTNSPSAAVIQKEVKSVIQKEVKSVIEMADKDALSKPASLSKNLPANAMAYLRLPSVKNTLSHKGTNLDPALGSKAMAEQVTKIYQPLIEKFTGLTEGAGKALMELLIADADGPLELALLEPADSGIPFPTAVIKLSLMNKSVESLQAKLSSLSDELPIVIVKQPTDSQVGEISIATFKLFIKFDSKSGEMMIVGGHMSVLDQTEFEQISKAIVPNTQHPMLDIEKEVDASGKGFFAWFGINQILPLYRNIIPISKYSKLQAAGLDKVESLVVGSGVSGGKAKFSIVVKMPETGFKQYLYKPNNSYNFTTAGEPRYLLALALPTQEQILKTEELIKNNLPQEQFQNWMMVKGMFAMQAGITFDDIFASIDSEMISFGDEAGDFLAIKLRDKAAFKGMLDNLVNKFKLPYEVREHKGQNYHHLVLPNFNAFQQAQMEKSALESIDPILANYLNVLKTFKSNIHLYWIESGKYLIMAGIPQVLMDRIAHKNEVNASDWLTKTQKIDPSKSLLLASTTVDDLPDTVYKFQLGMLNYLNDIANSAPEEQEVAEGTDTDSKTSIIEDSKTKFDIFNLPSPAQLNLPEDGTYSMQFDATDTRLALNITSDFSAVDVLLNQSGMTTVAIAGVLAAVAIPAYNEYTLKSKVQEAYEEMRFYTNNINLYYMEYGKYPSVDNVAEFSMAPANEIVYSYSLAPDTGVITGIIDLDGMQYDMITIRLIPEIFKGELIWSCKSSGGDEKYIPNQCR